MNLAGTAAFAATQVSAAEGLRVARRAATLDVLHGAVSTALKQSPTESSL